SLADLASICEVAVWLRCSAEIRRDAFLFRDCVTGGCAVLSPYGLDIIESCFTCKLRADRLFCDLPTGALQAFESIKYATAYPKGAVLFVEGQAPRGIYVLCKGRVKLSICSTDGKTLILKVAEPGEVLGLSATVSGKAYELT